MKRAIDKRKCPNPLFEMWLKEWRDEAREKNSSVENHFTKAITSLQKYPLHLESGRDCIILQHFGTKLCTMLDKKLKNHHEKKRDAHNSDIEKPDNFNDVENDIMPKKSRSLEGNSMNAEFVTKQKMSKGKKCTKSPIPGRRDHFISSSDSDSHDLPIVEILENDDEHSKKTTITNKPKENPKTSKTSKSKKTIQKSKSTDVESPINGGKSVETLATEQFHILPNNFDVLLLVDIHETGGGKTKSKDDATKSELDRSSTPYEVRHLKIGDFAWIARCKDTNRELILPYIVERKRMDDLASSIKDGRYSEQKFRLKQSGIPNLIYMIESHGNNQHTGIPLPALFQAATNSSVQDGFTIKFTNSHRDSMQYLSILTNLIYKIYKEKHLVSSTKEDLGIASNSGDRESLMEFNKFNKAASKIKIFKVKEMFVRQLLQLKGLSLEKVLAIVELYPTPLILTRAFEKAGKNAEKLLASIQVGSLRRQLGPTLSKTVFELYTKRSLE